MYIKVRVISVAAALLHQLPITYMYVHGTFDKLCIHNTRFKCKLNFTYSMTIFWERIVLRRRRDDVIAQWLW